MEVRGAPRRIDRKLHKFVGGPSNTVYSVHNHNFDNVRRGLMERVYHVERDGELVATPKPTISSLELNARLARFRSRLLKGWSIPPRLSIDDTVNLWTGRKRDTYQKAADSLLQSSVVECDAKLSTFVKAEKINLSTKGDPAPRVIQPRNPRYNLEVARYLKNTEHKLFHKIDQLFDWGKIGDKTIFKGLDSYKSGYYFDKKAKQYHNPVFIGLDASRFDQHVSVDILKFEHEIWSQLCGGDRKMLKKLLSWQINNVGVAHVPDGKIKYRVQGCRMSGDMNTSSGNCLVMCAMVYAYMHGLGIPKFSLANNGDDCMLILERNHVNRVMMDIPTWFSEMGFTMKVENPVYTIEQAEFCQTRCCYIDGIPRMIRNIKTACAKDCYSVTGLTHESRVKAWITAVGLGGRIANVGVPVLQAFYGRFPKYVDNLDSELASLLERKRLYGFSHADGVDDTPHEISPESRYSIWRAFGITPDEQFTVESQLCEWMISHELADSDTTQVSLLDVCSTA